MKSRLILATLFVFVAFLAKSQCSGGSSFASVTAPTTGTATTISTCNWAGDYNTISGITAGSNYTFTSTGGACITIHSGSPTGPVVAFGSGSVTFTAASSGTYYMTINVNCSGCGTGSTCLTTTITCNSCAAGPCSSITNIGGCGIGFVQTTSGSSSFISTLCATATPGLEMIYSYTATSTGNYSINVASITGGGVVFGWKAQSAGCSGTGWNCGAAVSTPGTYGTIALTAGTTYLFVVDATSTASTTVNFSLTCPAGGPTTASECAVGVNVCSSASFAIDPNGYGATNEICAAGTCVANPSLNPSGSGNPGCLLSGELNSTWMIINILTGGSLTFSMGTPSSGTFNCLDWSMWPYTASTCSGISAGTLAPVRCNYNGSCEQFTGLASTLPAGATSMTNWEPPLTVASGTKYVICLSNFSSATTTVPLSFGGTAVVSCTPLGAFGCDLSLNSTLLTNVIEWTAENQVNINDYSIEKSSDGLSFETIGKVPSNGILTSAQTYSFSDIEPIYGWNYYRIKWENNSGNTNYSDVKSINFTPSEDVFVLNCFPNPSSEKVKVTSYSKSNTYSNLETYNSEGKLMHTQSVHLEEGMNYIDLTIEQLPAGIYFIRYKHLDASLSTPFKLVVE